LKANGKKEMTILSIGGVTYQDLSVDQSTDDHKHDQAEEIDITKLEADQVFIEAGAKLKDDAALAFKPSDGNGNEISFAEYRFGRQENIGDTTALNDGISFKHVIDSEDQKVNIQLHPGAPTIKIEGSKNAGQDYIQVVDEDGNTVFAVHPDGQIETPGWSSGTHPDAHHSSLAVEPASMYVGSCKLSQLNGELVVSHLKSPPYIPTVLTQVPYSYTVNNINANPLRSINEWMTLARSSLSSAEAKALRIKDVFPPNSTDFEMSGSHHTHSLSENVQQALDAIRSVTNGPVTKVVHVDANYTGSGNGSPLKPFNSLKSAMELKLTDGTTHTYHFEVAPGTYTMGVSITHTNKTQSFSVRGSGEATILQTADLTNTCLYFRKFKDVEISNVTIQQCYYGAYLRDCDRIVLRDVRFYKCGSTAQVTAHDQSQSKAQQAAWWAQRSSNTPIMTNGGAMRIQTVTEATVTGCDISYCLRGLRIQDVGTAGSVSMISNNKVYRTLESGIYMASGTYDGNGGCVNVLVSNNEITEPFNNGVLVVGGSQITISGNSIQKSANTGIQTFSSLDCRIHANTLSLCNNLSYNGIGNDGDAYGQIALNGSSNIGSGNYIASVCSNLMLMSQQGRSSVVQGIVLMDRSETDYPVASRKVFISDNNCDCSAASFLINPKAISITETRQNRTALGYIADLTSSAQTQINTLTSALSGKQNTLTTAQQSVVDADPFTQSNYPAVIVYQNVSANSQFPATTAMIKSYVDAEIATCEPTLSNSQKAVTNGNVFSSGAQTILLNGKQDTLTFGTVTEGSANKVVYASDIKSYVDNAAGGSSGATSRFDYDSNTNYVQIDRNERFVTWSRSLGSSSGGSVAYYLPSAEGTDAISSGHIIYLQTFQKWESISLNTNHTNGGTIFLRIPASDQDNSLSHKVEFRSTSFHDDRIAEHGSGDDTCKITDVDRMMFVLHYFVRDNGDRFWLVQSCSRNFTDEQVRFIANPKYVKFFERTESSYPWVNQAYIDGTEPVFDLPEGFHEYQVIYGDASDGDDVNRANVVGCMVRLPQEPLNGCHVLLVTNFDTNFTGYNDGKQLAIYWHSENANRVIKWQFGMNNYEKNGSQPWVFPVMSNQQPSYKCHAYFDEDYGSDGIWYVRTDTY